MNQRKLSGAKKLTPVAGLFSGKNTGWYKMLFTSASMLSGPKKALSRPKKAAFLPAVLDRYLVYILPTRHGVIFILVLAGMLAGSINYNNNLGFLLVFLLGGTALVSMIHTYRNLLGLQILSVSAAPVFAGENAVFGVLVRPGTHDRTAIAVYAEKNSNKPADFTSRFDATVSVVFPTGQRGILRPGPIYFSTVYPLGLFRAWAVLKPEHVSCIVYPAPRYGYTDDDYYTDAKDGRRRGFFSGTDDFKGLKPYQPGDVFQHVAWKTLSRGQGLFTKDFGGDSDTSVLIFDFYRVPAEDTETRLSELCGMILRASRKNMHYGLVLPGKTIAPDGGSAHRGKCLKALAVF